MVHAFNLNAQETEVGRFLGQHGLQSKFLDRQRYREKPCLKKKSKKQTNKKVKVKTGKPAQLIKCTV